MAMYDEARRFDVELHPDILAELAQRAAALAALARFRSVSVLDAQQADRQRLAGSSQMQYG